MSHLPIDYRPAGESRHSPPAEVCGTCSDFDAGRLVPVSFCEQAKAASEEFHLWLSGPGPRPLWLDSGDAMVVRFTEAGDSR